jgi:transcriptional regulator with XRE-family HTH domain
MLIPYIEPYNKTKIIGERLKKARKDSELTLAKVAEKIGKEQYQTVSKYESENSVPSFDVVLKLCNLYGCEIDYILGLIDNKTKSHKDICEMTGLSEEAADTLLRWKRSGYSVFGTDFFSEILKDKKLMYDLEEAGREYSTIKNMSENSIDEYDGEADGKGWIVTDKNTALKFLAYEVSRLITNFTYRYLEINSEDINNAEK